MVVVDLQGDMMDRIEKSVESASEYVAVAAVEIQNAVEYQTKARKVSHPKALGVCEARLVSP